MLCEKCKTREANVLITEIVNGIKSEHYYCAHCASGSQMGHFLDADFSLGKLLSGILGMQPDATEDKMGQLTCPTCHMTYGEFAKNSVFGCADCYHTFGLLLENNIKKIQGNDTHLGKRPKYQKPDSSYEEQVETLKSKESNDEQLAILSSRLQEAIQEEEYELAAKYRDEIKQLKERMRADA